VSTLVVSVGNPSWPVMFDPQQKAVPSRERPQLCERPTLIDPKVIAREFRIGVTEARFTEFAS
jgi:hypothetical protein